MQPPLYAPWRMDYIRSLHKPAADECFLCAAAAAATAEDRRERGPEASVPPGVGILVDHDRSGHQQKRHQHQGDHQQDESVPERAIGSRRRRLGGGGTGRMPRRAPGELRHPGAGSARRGLGVGVRLVRR